MDNCGFVEYFLYALNLGGWDLECVCILVTAQLAIEEKVLRKRQMISG